MTQSPMTDLKSTVEPDFPALNFLGSSLLRFARSSAAPARGLREAMGDWAVWPRLLCMSFLSRSGTVSICGFCQLPTGEPLAAAFGPIRQCFLWQPLMASRLSGIFSLRGIVLTGCSIMYQAQTTPYSAVQAKQSRDWPELASSFEGEDGGGFRSSTMSHGVCKQNLLKRFEPSKQHDQIAEAHHTAGYHPWWVGFALCW